MEGITWTSDAIVAGRMSRCDAADDRRHVVDDDDDVVFNTLIMRTKDSIRQLEKVLMGRPRNQLLRP